MIAQDREVAEHHADHQLAEHRGLLATSKRWPPIRAARMITIIPSRTGAMGSDWPPPVRCRRHGGGRLGISCDDRGPPLTCDPGPRTPTGRMSGQRGRKAESGAMSASPPGPREAAAHRDGASHGGPTGSVDRPAEGLLPARLAGRPHVLRHRPEASSASDRVGPAFTGPDPDAFLERDDEDLAVADLPLGTGPASRDDGVDRHIDEIVVDRDLELDLPEQVHLEFRAPVHLRESELPAEALNLGDGETIDLDRGERPLDRLELVGLDELSGFDVTLSRNNCWVAR